MRSVFGALLIYFAVRLPKPSEVCFFYLYHILLFVFTFQPLPSTLPSLHYILIIISHLLHICTHTRTHACWLSHYLLLADVKGCFAHLLVEIISSARLTHILLILFFFLYFSSIRCGIRWCCPHPLTVTIEEEIFSNGLDLEWPLTLLFVSSRRHSVKTGIWFFSARCQEI